MSDELFTTITNINITHIFKQIIKHVTFQYVDDSTNLVSSNNPEYLQQYINNFFSLLEAFYNINKLTLNSDKSKLLIVCKNNLREKTKNIT